MPERVITSPAPVTTAASTSIAVPARPAVATAAASPTAASTSPAAASAATLALPAAATVAVPVTPPPPAAIPLVSPANLVKPGTPNSYTPPPFSPTPSIAIASELTHEPGQLLVLWTSEEATAKGIAVLLERYQLRPRQRYNLGQLGLTVVMIALPTQKEALALRDTLRSAHSDWIVDLNARSVSMQGEPIEEASARLYAQKMLGLVATPVLASTVPLPIHFRLGVVDTGIDPSFAVATALNGTTITQRSVLGPADMPAATEHGTAVLLLLAAKARANGFAGAAPALQLAWASAMRQQGDKASTNSLLLSVALDWLVGKQVQLINMSLGGQGDAVLQAVIAKVLAKRVAIVAAVGNNPASDAPLVYPAGYAGVWAVTAVDANGKRYAQANRNMNAHWAAPGVQLWLPLGKAGEGRYLSGTSFATALASAVLAWQPAPFWGLSAAQQAEKVCKGAQSMGSDVLLGCGLLRQSLVN
jgi:Subtilase family